MFTGYLGILQLLSSRPVKELVAQVAAVGGDRALLESEGLYRLLPKHLAMEMELTASLL